MFYRWGDETKLTLTLFMLRMLPQSSMYCFRSFSRYSKTNVNDFSVWTISCRVTGKRTKNVAIIMRLFGTSFFIGDSIKGGTTADESLSGGGKGRNGTAQIRK